MIFWSTYDKCPEPCANPIFDAQMRTICVQGITNHISLHGCEPYDAAMSWTHDADIFKKMQSG